MRQAKFGKAPSGKRLERIRQSPHYKKGIFQNQSFTPSLTEGYTYTGVLYNFLFRKNPGNKPKTDIPSAKTNLKNLPADTDTIIWFGHSSYFMQIGGITFLVDPVLSKNASPVPGSTKVFKGADVYRADDLPVIDYLLISHDHYDHLDYKTIKGIQNKVKQVICGLGVGSHLEHWGYPEKIITEQDWYEHLVLPEGWTIHTLPARHFSGRTFKRNNTLWVSFLLETTDQKIFVGGDSGYDKHFSEIGERFGPIDLAILENGQYNLAWQAIHCLPEETLQAATALQAKRIMPVHNSKFSLAPHHWKEPLQELFRINADYRLHILSPMIGEAVHLNDPAQKFSNWQITLNE